MIDWLAAIVSRILNLPGEPEPPAGRPGSVRVFRAAPGFLRYRRASWFVKQAGAVVGLAFGFLLLRVSDTGIKHIDKLNELVQRWGGLQWIEALEYLAVAAFLLQLIPSWMFLTLDYRYRWYVTTDRSLRIRDGLWRTEERTMTYSNLQNVEVRQGPLQRLFGIADLRVQTAGGGGSEEEASSDPSKADPLHVGRFRGIDNAEEIREAISAKLRELEDTGLGHPDAPRPKSEGSQALSQRAALEGAQAVLEQTRRLAQALR